LKDRDVLVIDDIFDTGHTLVEVLAQLLTHVPASIRSAVLMQKIDRSEVPIQPDYVMFEIPDEFVVGYGLDYEDRFRNLPYVAALEPEDLAQTVS
jgi:hypoxanthine phosphoribosyltransferase